MAGTQIEYTLFFPQSTKINEIKNEIEGIYRNINNQYIWHNECFHLNVATSELAAGLLSLTGCTDVGENINDEWFIVYLLHEISKRFTECVIEVNDSDGDFLLIEAADELPSWLKPESSENRVFIHDGALHIIPLPSNPAEISILPTSKPTYENAYNLILSKNINTQASENIQGSIFKKIQCYPEKITADFHNANCYVPVEIVYMLQTKPHLVAKAVQAFYERDPIDVKVCQKMKNFKSHNRVLYRVKFTKHLYSQLSQARFLPDKSSGWKLAPTNDALYKPSELGFKLTCGFEILVSRVTNIKEENDQPRGRFWEQYFDNLTKNGYFQSEMEGSKKYKELLQQAKEQYKSDFSNDVSSTSSSNIGREILQMINDSKPNIEEIKRSAEDYLPDDNDDWMTVTPDDLDKMMVNMWGGDKTVEQQSENLTDLVGNMKSFVDQVSSYEGAEVPNSMNTEKAKTHQNGIGLRDRLAQEDLSEDEEFNFDPKEFFSALKQIADPNGDCSFNQDSDSDLDDEFISCKNDTKYEDNNMNDLVNQMDDELGSSSMAKSFQDKGADGNENFDVDVNLIRNFIDSFNSQDGLSGPVSNILQSMGINLPPEDGT